MKGGANYNYKLRITIDDQVIKPEDLKTRELDGIEVGEKKITLTPEKFNGKTKVTIYTIIIGTFRAFSRNEYERAYMIIEKDKLTNLFFKKIPNPIKYEISPPKNMTFYFDSYDDLGYTLTESKDVKAVKEASQVQLYSQQNQEAKVLGAEAEEGAAAEEP